MGGGGVQNQPWILETLICEGVKLERKIRLKAGFSFFCLYTTQLIVSIFYLHIFNSVAKNYS
jgi:hypothetical protein